jgi:molybdopterin molybdotransferase
VSDELVPVDEHLATVLGAVHPLAELELRLLDAHGCILAEDVVAAAPLPGFDNSAMDGYAVRSGDVAAATPETPVVLPVVGDVAAGAAGEYRVQPGLCVRIMTGAPLPPGADSVVPVEWTDGGTGRVAVRRAAAPGTHVRRAGEDVTAGEVVLESGSYLGAPQIGLLAAVGRARVLVRPRPRVVVISTGSELTEPGAELPPGAIRDANSYLLAAAVHEAGGIGYRAGIVRDEPAALRDALEDHLVRADVLLTSGGVSVGAYDVVKNVLAQLGTVRFLRVAMQPGMPQGFGTIGPDGVPFFGLPGNPVSAYVSFEVFVRPALRRLLGAEPVTRPTVRATLLGPVRSPPGKRSFLRGRLAVREGVYAVEPVGRQGSHLQADLARANALIVVPEPVTELPAGESVTVTLLERRHS